MGDAEDKKGGDSVKVAVRLRPLSNKELGNNESSIIELETNSELSGSGKVTIVDPTEKDQPSEFAFDLVFGTDVLQETVFRCVGEPALGSMLTGYNSTIFAYGQTGSGKSWSMTGGGGDLRGIIPRVNDELFVRIASEMEKVSTRRFLVQCSFFEIYNEIIFDLLNPVQDKGKLGAGLQVKEHPVLGIYVKDLSEIVVQDGEKLSHLMDSGTKNRAVSSTMMNASSSRSHSIFTIKVHQKDEEDKSRNVFAKLNLVDLAGSERQKGTGATGQTLKEGANINKSLSALGNVINALVEIANGKKVFVPFRNSKLTRVLQESLGGNSLCTMLAALSPAACNYEETLSTLRYANRAKAIKVNATKNEEASQISRLNAEIEELKKKLAGSAGEGGGGGGGGGAFAAEERAELEAKYQAQLADMQKMVSSTWEEKTRISSDQESQLTKALDAHRRQALAMQEECRKRFRLLKDQNDLELSIRGLLDTVLGLKVQGSASSTPLCSGDLPRQWLKVVMSIGEVGDLLKQQNTMVLVFHGSFKEDLQLWVDGEEANDGATARTGARRALTNLETLRRECEKLSRLEAEGRTKVQEFVAAVQDTQKEWSESGRDAVRAALREADGSQETEGEPRDAQKGALPPIYAQTLEDIEKILELIAQQAEARSEELGGLAGLAIGPEADVLLKGASLVEGAAVGGPDLELLRSLAAEAPPAPAARSTPPTPAGGAAPREARALHEWTQADVDDTVEGTANVLSQVIELEALHKKRSPQELLARPPPKFVHDVALLIQEATGFPQTMSTEWPEPREGKVDLLQQICDSTASILHLESIDFDPECVLKGKEVPKTLRLLQLLAVAAARDKAQSSGSGGGAQAPDGGGKAEKLTHASEIPKVLEAIARCMQVVVEKQAQRKVEDGQTSPTHELESSYRALQEKLEEEAVGRTRREETISKLQQEVATTRSVLKERYVNLEQAKSAAGNIDSMKTKLRQQVEALRAGLLEKAQKVKGNPQVDQMRGELKDLASQYSSKSAARTKLGAELRRLRERQLEIETQRETAELEMRRFKLRLAEGLEAPKGDPQQSQEILLLQAEKQKWDVRIAALEDKMRTIAESDDTERQQETGIMEEKKLQGSKNDEAKMQLETIRHELDDLREGMDSLFQEKTNVEFELENLSSGYVDLSERLMTKEDEARELEEQLQKYEELLKMLRQNAEKSRHSPAKGGSAPTAEAGGGTAASATAAADADEAGSQYSDDFEEHDGDDD